ncbi:MAG: NADPH:quinone oxidoreductase family protein [Burkholderiaceae bacterium]
MIAPERAARRPRQCVERHHIQSLGLICHELAEDLAGVSLAPLSLPPPGPGQALVRVGAAALNFPDLLMTRGGYQFRPEPPFVIGMEGCGRVEALGQGVQGPWRVGDRVVFGGKTGACATHALVPLDSLERAPESLDDGQAAAYTVGASTAYASLVERAHLRAGQWLLVHGASGGMGMAAAQLGIQLGAQVIATARNVAAHDTLRAMGVRACLGTAAGLHEEVKQLTGGRGVDVVFDPVGGDMFDESMRAVCWGGTILIVGFTSGRIARMATNHALIKNLAILGVRAGEMQRRDAGTGERIRAAIAGLAHAPGMAPVIGARFPLERASEALRALQSRSFIGKIVIENKTGDR